MDLFSLDLNTLDRGMVAWGRRLETTAHAHANVLRFAAHASLGTPGMLERRLFSLSLGLP